VIIEGGRQTLQTFIDANLWDEARFRGTIHFKEGTAAPILSSGFSLNKIGQDELIISRNHD
jgi:diaminohydroxyphosphoribosylaminopyrimidine deaminase/5-amino-6-(5-phosphoribosylamino)uracil reductase